MQGNLLVEPKRHALTNQSLKAIACLECHWVRWSDAGSLKPRLGLRIVAQTLDNPIQYGLAETPLSPNTHTRIVTPRLCSLSFQWYNKTIENRQCKSAFDHSPEGQKHQVT